MIQIELDLLKTAEQNVFDHMAEGDSIVHQFEVVPFDYRVINRATPIFYVTNYSIYFVYDDLMELFTLSELEMDILGEAPKFSPWQLWFEGKSYYSETQGESFLKLKNATYYSRLSFNEKGQVPKEFALREGPNVGYSYQSWAMAQLLINTKNGLQIDTRLQELFKGNFAKYNKTTIITFVAVLLGYVLIKSLLGNLSPVIGVVLDILFGGFSAFMLWWIYKSMEKNLRRFKAVYDGYSVSYTKSFDGSVKEGDEVDRTVTKVSQISNSPSISTIKEQALIEQEENKKLVEALSVISELNKEKFENEENSQPQLQQMVQPQQVTQQQLNAPQQVAQQPNTQFHAQQQYTQPVQQVSQQQPTQQQPEPDSYNVRLQPSLQKQPVYQAPGQMVDSSQKEQQKITQQQPTPNSNGKQIQGTSINPNIVRAVTSKNLNQPNVLNMDKQPIIPSKAPLNI